MYLKYLMADPIVQLPTDNSLPNKEELTIVNTLFKNITIMFIFIILFIILLYKNKPGRNPVI